MNSKSKYPVRYIKSWWDEYRATTAATILAAMLANPNADRYGKEAACRNAVAYADKLIKILKEETNDTNRTN